MGQGASTQTLNPNPAYITGESFQTGRGLSMKLACFLTVCLKARAVLLFPLETIWSYCVLMLAVLVWMIAGVCLGKELETGMGRWGECMLMECGDCAIGHSHVSVKHAFSRIRPDDMRTCSSL